MTFQIVIYALVTGTEALLIALSLYLVHRVSNVVNLALGGIAAAGAYSFYLTFSVFSWSVWAAAGAAFLVALILGAFNYWLNEPFTKKREYLLALLVSFAFGIALESLIAISFGTDGKSLLPGILSTFTFGPYQISLPGALVLIVGVAFALLAFFAYFLTPLGKRIQAISENHHSAGSLGINASRIRCCMYMGAAVVAAVVGTLVGFDTALVPTMGFNLIVTAFIALLVGGVSDLRGTVIAAYVVAFIPELIIGLVPAVSSNWRMAFVFLIAAILLSVRPHGILSVKKRLA